MMIGFDGAIPYIASSFLINTTFRLRMRILLLAILLTASLTACKENAGGESVTQTSGPADGAASATDPASPAPSAPTPDAAATASVPLTGTQWVLESRSEERRVGKECSTG